MTQDTATKVYASPSRKASLVHADRECYRLAHVHTIREAESGYYSQRRRCPDCYTPTAGTQNGQTAPESVPCPCGNGEAKRRKLPTTEVSHSDRERIERHYHYRHSGCPFGGTLVTVNGKRKRASGPVFEPERFGAKRESETVLTDGGDSNGA